METQEAAGFRARLPGLAVAIAATMAAGYLSDHYNAPLTLMALLVGLALNFLSEDVRLAPGLAFASHTLLRWGIVLIGARVTLGQVLQLGPMALAAIATIVGLTITSAVILSRQLGRGSAFGILAGSSVAICGASAAMAVATMLGERRINQAQLTVVLVIVSAASSFAMFLYPIVAHVLRLDDAQAGFLMGAAIHDVAQSLGAGYSYSAVGGDIAAIVKLSRVALLAPVLALIAYFMPRLPGDSTRVIAVPLFVIGFFFVAAVNTASLIPQPLPRYAEGASAALLACAVAATGIRSPLSALLKSDPKPLLIVTATTLTTFVLALGAATIVIVF